MVIWDIEAVLQLEAQLDYIKLESIQQAEKVREKILSKTADLSIFSKRHPKGKYKSENDGTYRTFEIYNFRISYRITDEHIRIVGLRSVHQNPQNY